MGKDVNNIGFPEMTGGYVPSDETPTHFLGRGVTERETERRVLASRVPKPNGRPGRRKRIARTRVAPGIVIAYEVPESSRKNADRASHSGPGDSFSHDEPTSVPDWWPMPGDNQSRPDQLGPNSSDEDYQNADNIQQNYNREQRDKSSSRRRAEFESPIGDPREDDKEDQSDPSDEAFPESKSSSRRKQAGSGDAEHYIHIWLSNDEWLYNDTRGMNAQQIRQYLEDLLIPAENGLAQDIMRAALSDVDWNEVAQDTADEDETEE